MADIGRATVVLDAIAEAHGALSLTELAGRTGLPRSTVHRVVQALERELFVVRAPERRGYVLGPGLLKFGMNAHVRLLSANRSSLAGLARAVGENVELAVFSGREVVVVDQLASPERLRGVSKVGKSFSLHASCIGMALLAQLPDAQVAELLRPPLTRFTPGTVVDPQRIQARLGAIRGAHIAVDREEHDIGICAVATAFVGPTAALQAMAIVIPTSRFRDKYERAVDALRRVNPLIP